MPTATRHSCRFEPTLVGHIYLNNKPAMTKSLMQSHRSIPCFPLDLQSPLSVLKNGCALVHEGFHALFLIVSGKQRMKGPTLK